MRTPPLIRTLKAAPGVYNIGIGEFDRITFTIVMQYGGIILCATSGGWAWPGEEQTVPQLLL